MIEKVFDDYYDFVLSSLLTSFIDTEDYWSLSFLMSFSLFHLSLMFLDIEDTSDRK